MICTVNATRCTFCALFSSSTGTTTVAPSRGFGFSEITHSTRWRVSIFPFGWITYARRSFPMSEPPPAARM